jgi:hypothetical protein
MVCEKVDDLSHSKPADAIAGWQDGDGTFYLRKSSASELPGGGDVEADRIHVGGTSSAVWRLGKDAFCKVRAWCEGLELEVNTIRFVGERNAALEVPLPELIHSWIDYDLNRTFLITKRVCGQTLERA